MEKAYELLELRQLLMEIPKIDDLELKKSWQMLAEKLYELYVSAFGEEQLPLKFYYSALDIPDVKEIMSPDDPHFYLGALNMKVDKWTMENMFRSEILEHEKKYGTCDDLIDLPNYRFLVALRQLLNKDLFYLKLYLPPASCGLDTPFMKLIREMNLA